MTRFPHSEITKIIIGASFEIWNELGYGFLEKVYENAMMVELGIRDVHVIQQTEIDVSYKNRIVGHYVPDLFVEKKVIVELKAEKTYKSKHEAQLLNYLKASGIQIGLLLNFGENKVEFKRMIR